MLVGELVVLLDGLDVVEGSQQPAVGVRCSTAAEAGFAGRTLSVADDPEIRVLITAGILAPYVSVVRGAR